MVPSCITFQEGKTLDEIEKNRKNSKWSYQKFLMSVGCAAFGALLGALSYRLA